MTNKDGHRRFGSIRKRESGRYQIRYIGPDGQEHAGQQTFARKSDAEKALVLIEADISAGSWSNPERGKVKLEDYAAAWIEQRPGLRPRTVDLYRGLLKRHIAPRIGKVSVGKVSSGLVREWRAELLADGVSVSVAAKSYRLLRAIMTTAVDDDGLLSRNPCRIRGASDEHAEERPVLTAGQVYELAGRLGTRPKGNIRATPDGYRLRFARDGIMRTSPERYATRADAERTLWTMAGEGRADSTQDGRFRAMVLLTTFASLRWGEVSALTRADIDLKARAVRVRAAYVRRDRGPLLLGPPKSKAGRRVVGIPAAIVPDLEAHLAKYVKPEPGALVFPGVMGGPIRRQNFNKLTGWAHAAEAIGVPGLHFHDLRHAGNQFAASSGAGLRDLMARMGHDSTRAAMIYQHEARGADRAITDAIDKHLDKHLDDKHAGGDEGDDGLAGAPVPA